MDVTSPDRAGQRHDWRSRSACLSADPNLFFPVSAIGAAARQVASAKAICAGCPVAAACLGFAMSHREVLGIWGGTTDDERRRARRAASRRAARRARSAA